jgi:DNA-binding NarL/FixJ family response regulator
MSRSNSTKHDNSNNPFRALIVEDNIPFRQFFQENLHDHFPLMAVEEAGEGVEAMQKVNSGCPDLIFMDIRLPGESGLDLTKKIKQKYPDVKIMILTSYDLPEYRETAKKYGADHFIIKGSASWDEIINIVTSISSELGKPVA